MTTPQPGAAGAPFPALPPVKKVSGAGYWIGSIVLVVGIGVGLVLLVSAVTGVLAEIQDAPHVNVGDSGSVVLNRTGCQELYLVSASGSTVSFSTPKVTMSRDGVPLTVDSAPCPSAQSNSLGDSGILRVIGSVQVPSSGTYLMKVDRPSGVSTSGQYVSVVRPFEEIAVDVGAKVLLGLGLGFVGFAAGLAVLIITGVRRRKARRRSFGPPPPMAPYAGPGGPWAGGPWAGGPPGPSAGWGPGPGGPGPGLPPGAPGPGAPGPGGPGPSGPGPGSAPPGNQGWGAPT